MAPQGSVLSSRFFSIQANNVKQNNAVEVWEHADYKASGEPHYWIFLSWPMWIHLENESTIISHYIQGKGALNYSKLQSWEAQLVWNFAITPNSKFKASEFKETVFEKVTTRVFSACVSLNTAASSLIILITLIIEFYSIRGFFFIAPDLQFSEAGRTRHDIKNPQDGSLFIHLCVLHLFVATAQLLCTRDRRVRGNRLS